MKFSTDYIPAQDAWVKLGKYPQGNIALQVYNAEHKLLATATVNMPQADLAPNEVIIKDYSENAGMLTALIELNIIKLTDWHIVEEFVAFPICQLLPETEWLLPIID